MCLISVIVPVYNTEKYLKRCLDSLVNQTISDIEILVINDSSPDNSQKIIDNYVFNYPGKVISFVKPNGGLSSARNFGIGHATGQYIAFVDSDDWVDLNLYQSLYNKAMEDKCDIVCCNFIEQYSNCQITCSVIPADNYNNRYIGNVVAWNKLYLREFWMKNKFSFFAGIYHEDLELIPKVLLATRNIAYIDSSYYYYEKTNSSAITSGNTLHVEIFPLICKQLLRADYKTDNEFKVFIADLAYIYIMHNKNPIEAQQFFLEYKELFRFKNILKTKRKIMVILLKINFRFFRKLNRWLERK